MTKLLVIPLVAASSASIVVISWYCLSSGAMLQRFSQATGLTLENIVVNGTRNVPVESVVDAAGYSLHAPILSIDLWKGKQGIESRLRWVKKVVIARKLPDTLEIFIEERVPVAIWQNDQGNSLIIDSDGSFITNHIEGDKFSNLPILRGKNANYCYQDVKQILKADRVVAENILSLTRVGDRRWTIFMKNGIEVMLPEDEYIEAWSKAAEILNGNTTQLKSIDMRTAGKIFFVKK